MVLNANNTGSTLIKKTVALRYHFFTEHVDNNVVEARKIYTIDSFSDPFTKHLVINDIHGFYHECMVNG